MFLASRKDVVLLDAADEAFYRKGCQAGRLTRDMSISTGTSSKRKQSRDQIKSEDKIDSAIDMCDRTPNDFRWLDEEEELDLQLNGGHTAEEDTAEEDTAEKDTSHPHQRQSFRRHLSLSALPFRRSSTPSMQTSNPPMPSAPYARPLSALLTPSYHRSRRSVSSLDPRASHYQDPEARLKLRVYLASPQKFDEAVEFGFPSVQDRLHYSRTRSNPRLTHESGRTFFTEDTPSLSADEDEQEREQDREMEDFGYPRTPEESNVQYRRQSSKSSVDKSHFTRFRIVRGSLEPYAHGSVADREMTLHMTLTRPDLRDADDLQPIKHINDEPLEQPALSFEDPTRSIWDTLPAESSMVKKIWKKLIHKQ
jgi:hypothetical protein